MIMDYCPGGDMRGLINHKRKITEDDSRIYLAEILLAIEEL
jgi:serine/threonine protein kinase